MSLNQILKDQIKLIQRLNRGVNLSNEESVCRETLLSYTTYRLPQSSDNDLSSPIKVLYRLTKRKNSREKSVHTLNPSNKTLILAPRPEKRDDIVKHINIQTGEEAGYFISKDHISHLQMQGEDSLNWMSVYLFALGTFFSTLFKGNRQRKSLQIWHIYESSLLIHWMKNNGIKTLYDFAGFHIDSNYLALSCKLNGIKVVKSPSPGALETHYKHLLTHTICASNPYHIEELQRNKETMLFEKLEKWRPQMSHLYKEEYFQNRSATLPKTIAFYSHGEWLRRELGHSDVGRGTLETENFILEILNHEYSSLKDFELVIYPHPLERRVENFEKTKAYYAGKLKARKFRFVDEKVRTADDFQNVNVALVAASTLIYERLYCGFKILIGMLTENKIFHQESELNNICFHSAQEFEELMSKHLHQSNEEFFKETGLGGYHYESFD